MSKKSPVSPGIFIYFLFSLFFEPLLHWFLIAIFFWKIKNAAD
nr:MAG TPA: hypothetical protein [Caudoviricetes sp.]